jgi:hypothetical protein
MIVCGRDGCGIWISAGGNTAGACDDAIGAGSLLGVSLMNDGTLGIAGSTSILPVGAVSTRTFGAAGCTVGGAGDTVGGAAAGDGCDVPVFESVVMLSGAVLSGVVLSGVALRRELTNGFVVAARLDPLPEGVDFAAVATGDFVVFAAVPAAVQDFAPLFDVVDPPAPALACV